MKDHAIILLTTLDCIWHSEPKGDEVYFEIFRDGVKWKDTPLINTQAGNTSSVNVEIECTYLNELTLKMWEYDSVSSNDYIGTVTINRSTQLNANNEGVAHLQTNDDQYDLHYRLITNPIPTVRVLGIYCEAQTANMNVDLVNAIADVTSAACNAASKVIGLSPRPSRQLISKGFEAVGDIITGVAHAAEWIAGVIEGDDDIVLVHNANITKGAPTGFFPEGGGVCKMHMGKMVYFEEDCGHYYRFPLDSGKVAIEFREYDPVRYDCIAGSIIIDPANLNSNTSDGISGGSPSDGDSSTNEIVGGLATLDGPAVIEVANSYYGRGDGQGAVYYICYSIGMEDWCQPANTIGQNAIDPNIYYKLENKQSKMVWNVEGGVANVGSPIIQWADVDTANEKFYFSPNGYGNFNIKDSQNHRNAYPSTSGNNQLILGSEGAKYTMEKQVGGYYRIMTKGLPVGVDNSYQGYKVRRMNSDVNGDDYLWKLIPVLDPNKRYIISNQKSALCLNVPGKSHSSGVDLIQWPYEGGASNETFYFHSLNNGKYHIKTNGSNLYVRPSGGPGSAIEQSTSAAEFTLESWENGFYRILHDGNPVKVYGGSFEREAKIILGGAGEEGPEYVWRIQEAPH